MPACVIAEDQGIFLPPHCSEVTCTLIYGVRLVVVKGAAHSIHSEKPELLTGATNEFITQ
jgi:pimeloyl-ACP methyl ester carboxylesterase